MFVIFGHSSKIVFIKCGGSWDQTLLVDPLSNFLLQPVFYNWCSKGHGMCCPVCGRKSLFLIRETGPHISLWLNPTGHSKFHNTSNHPLPATDSGQTARTPLYPPGQVVPLTPSPFFFPVQDRGTGKGQYLCPWQACATTACSECAR